MENKSFETSIELLKHLSIYLKDNNNTVMLKIKQIGYYKATSFSTKLTGIKLNTLCNKVLLKFGDYKELYNLDLLECIDVFLLCNKAYTFTLDIEKENIIETSRNLRLEIINLNQSYMDIF